jgi:CopG antitoxin of type II toxin-antitoxin system
MAEEQQSSTRRSRSRIPSFTTIEEEAAFWDTHDSAEFEDEFEDVTDIRFVPARSQRGIIVPLEQATLRQLHRQAREQGVEPAVLVRMWIVERLRTRPTEPESASHA